MSPEVIKLFALHFQSRPFILFRLSIGEWYTHTHMNVRSSIQRTAQHTILKVGAIP